MKSDIPLKMRAIVVKENGANPVVAEMAVPVPGQGEVLIKMHSTPINPSDLSFLAGSYGIKKPYPVVSGFEGSGTVVASGKGILPKIWLGKKVACAAYSEYNGCWAEYMVTKAGMCVPLSKKVTMEQGSMMFVNPMTALAFFDIYNKLPNPLKKKRGIINTAAASALGKMVIKLGKLYNIPVISVVRRDEQIDILKAEGAENILNSNDSNFENKLKELAHKLNATVIFDAVCGKLTQQILDAVPNGSTLFIYGRLSKETFEINPGDLIFTGNQIQGFWLTNWLQGKSLIQNVKYIRKIQSLLGKELGTNIYKTFSPEQIMEAVETYKNSMSKGKVLIQF